MVHLALLFSSTIASISQNKKLCLKFAFFILIIFAVLRYGFGNDYFNYYRSFMDIMSGHSQFVNEPMFTFLTKVFPNYFLLIAVTSLITIIPIYFLIKNYVIDNYKGLAVFIYCINPYLFLLSLSAIRQMLALSFFIVGIHFSEKRRIVPYLICIILATTCHISAIVLLPIYLIANDKKINRIQVMAIILVLLILLFGNNAFEILLHYGLDFFNNINYNIYSTQGGNTLRATLLSSIWFIYITININKLKGSTLMFAKLSLVGYIFAILAYKISMLTRFTMYFECFSIISIPMILYQNRGFKSKNIFLYLANKYALPMLIFTIYILRYYSFFTNPLWESFFEYHTILSVM